MRVLICVLLLVGIPCTAFAEIAIDIEGSSVEIEGQEKLKIRHIALPGDSSSGGYWATFQWNRITFSWDLLEAGVEINAIGRLPDTGQISSHTETEGEDSDFLRNSPVYETREGDTVADLITDLTWQKFGSAESHTWEEAKTYCADLEIGGYADWWLPGVWEAMSLLDLEHPGVSFNVHYFSYSSGTYWLSTESASDSSDAWSWMAPSGGINRRRGEKTQKLQVRCVRGETLNYGQFQDNGDGTISDTETKLQWQAGFGSDRIWESSLAYCNDLSLAGHDDWRLPNVKELWTIFDFSLPSPSIDSSYFSRISHSFNTSTTRAESTTRAWGLGQNGDYISKGKDNPGDVRCVRNLDT